MKIKTIITFTSITTGSTMSDYPDNTTTIQFDGTDCTVETMCDQYVTFLRAVGYTYIRDLDWTSEGDEQKPMHPLE